MRRDDSFAEQENQTQRFDKSKRGQVTGMREEQEQRSMASLSSTPTCSRKLSGQEQIQGEQVSQTRMARGGAGM